MFTANKLYFLLVVVPVAAVSPQLGLSDGAIFSLSCIAILPLAALLGDATEQLALHTNETLGGLLNATFGNATELIVSFFLLLEGELDVVKVSLLGSILSNSLLVMGFACLASGLVKREVTFDETGAGNNTNMLLISIMGISIPTLMLSIGQFEVQDETDLSMSHFISVVLLVLYGFYLVFTMTEPEKEKGEKLLDAEKDEEEDDDDEEEEAFLTLGAAVFWLLLATVILAYLSELLAGAVEVASEDLHIPKAFVGFVIIPIIGNAAEHSTAVVMANKLKMDLALSVAQGSSTQIALFVIPVMVLLAWAVGQPLDLLFGVFETVITFLSAVIVSGIVMDGKTNWLEGMMLLAAYILIASAFWFYKDQVE
eukprot:Transcript_3763.p1 GENE.Transcript_3763~~Transcript_3763.p1  ORF type:complete len:369 (+),score=245.36 Transcript_3763:703-1809(+)